MRKITKAFLSFLAACFVFFVFFAVSVYADDLPENFDSLYYRQNADEDNTKIRLEQGLDEKTYLFLPASADFSDMYFTYDTDLYQFISFSQKDVNIKLLNGVHQDMEVLFDNGRDETQITVSGVLQDGSVCSKDVIVMRSSCVRTLYYTSDSPYEYGRPYVDEAKSNDKAAGQALLVAADGTVDFSGVVKQMKGRGNTTFEKFDKKPYQMKLDKKTELIDGAGKSKKWILLANAADPSMIRNSVTLSVAEQLGLPYTGKFESIDFYYDGEYRGTYLLTEKVEIGESRIEISDTDDLIEKANAENPAYAEPVTKTVAFSDGQTLLKGDAAGSVRYVDALIEPDFSEDCTHHAYLLEFELKDRYPDELTGFVTLHRQRIVTKNPEYLTREQGLFIANYWQEFEDAVYSADGYNKKTGKYYYEYCDLDSLAKCYVLNELVKNCDYYGSSTFFYLPENSDMFVCGPLWDYDLAYGIGYDLDRESLITKPEYFYCAKNAFAEALLKIESFRNKVKELLLPGGEVYDAANSLVGKNGTVATLSAEIADSQRMNYKLWDITNCAMPAVSQAAGLTYEQAIATMDRFISVRLEWLAEQIGQWDGDDYFIMTKPELEMLEDILNALFSRIEKILKVYIDLIKIINSFI